MRILRFSARSTADEKGFNSMLQNFREAIDAIAKLEPAQRGAYQTWLVVEMIRDVSYYILLALIAYTLGRRLIHALLAAIRESKRERA